MRLRIDACVSQRARVACALLLSTAVALSVVAQESTAPRTGPRVLFSVELPEMSGMNLTVVERVRAESAAAVDRRAPPPRAQASGPGARLRDAGRVAPGS